MSDLNKEISNATNAFNYHIEEYNIQDILSMYKKDRFVDFDGSWDFTKQSKFIESIILDLPINPIMVEYYTCEIYRIIDGQNRILSLSSFFKDNGFVLRNLKILNVLEKKQYCDLPSELGQRILSKRIEFIVFDIDEIFANGREIELIKSHYND